MKNQIIAIVDYGMGNIGSIVNMLQFLGVNSFVSNDINKIKSADKIILPGVGHFDKAMNNINQLNLKEPLINIALYQKKPFMGICLGMQLMCMDSEEGKLQGLGLISAHVKKFEFPANSNLKIPHMGWNEVEVVKQSKLLDREEERNRFYFVHSFFVDCLDKSDVLTTTNFGLTFVSAFEKENILGVQFHPEKSHRFGIQLFKNFIAI